MGPKVKDKRNCAAVAAVNVVPKGDDAKKISRVPTE
jgi:hypothetical protein